MLTQLLTALVLIPIIGWLGCVLMPKTWERTIFSIAFGAILLDLAVFVVLGYQWLNANAGREIPARCHERLRELLADEFTALREMLPRPEVLDWKP